MHAEIQRTQRLFLELFQAQRNYLNAKPDHYLHELGHQSAESRLASDYSEQVAAEINSTATALILQERGAGAEAQRKGDKKS